MLSIAPQDALAPWWDTKERDKKIKKDWKRAKQALLLYIPVRYLLVSAGQSTLSCWQFLAADPDAGFTEILRLYPWTATTHHERINEGGQIACP